MLYQSATGLGGMYVLPGPRFILLRQNTPRLFKPGDEWPGEPFEAGRARRPGWAK